MLKFLIVAAISLLIGACTNTIDDGPGGPSPVEDVAGETGLHQPDTSHDTGGSTVPDTTTALPDTGQDTGHIADPRALLRETLADLGIQPLEAPARPSEEKITLGQNLFFDPILSGSKDINCSMCHLMDAGTADGLSLSTGTGVVFEDGIRRPGPGLAFTPRNAQDLFNRGLEDVRTMFWDGRLDEQPDGRFVLHERAYQEAQGNYLRVMPPGLDNLLAAQSMLPVLDRDEMRGIHGAVDIFGEVNTLAHVPDHDLEGSWMLLMRRLMAIAGYQELFAAAYPDTPTEELSFVHAGNALSAFFVGEFTFIDTPWDDFVAGDDEALTDQQVRGANLFFGEAGCGECHSGRLLTDQKFHNIGVPPMTRGPEALEFMDLGAAHRSHAGPEARFAFRTPQLRNVTLTGPYMHNGAYTTLEAVIRHKLDARHGLWNYDRSQLDPQFRDQVHRRAENLARVEETLSPLVQTPIVLDDAGVEDLLAYLEALTSPNAIDLDHLHLESVPSGLPLPVHLPPEPEAP